MIFYPVPLQVFVELKQGSALDDLCATSQHVQVEESGERGWVQLDGNDQGLAAGQYAVFYQGGYCLGSAVITGSSTKIEARSGSSSEASPAELEEGSRC